MMFSKVLIADRAEVVEYSIIVDQPGSRPAAGDDRLARVAAVAAAIAEHNRRVQVADFAAPCGDRDAGVPSWRRANLFGIS